MLKNAVPIHMLLASSVLLLALSAGWPGTILVENKDLSSAFSNVSSPLGTNLYGLCDWSTEIPFIDAFKTSRPWISGNSRTGAWDDKRPIKTDANGWPTRLLPDQIARTVMFWDISKFPLASYPSGRYTVLYKGDGEIQYWAGAKKSADEIPSLGEDVLEVDPQKGGIAMNIIRTNPTNPIRDIHVIPSGLAGHSATQVFHPNFIPSIHSYRVIRFMDWMATNDSQQKVWSKRPKVTDARWDHGAPVEIMVYLANRLHADPWFNMPHQADDEYIRNFAKHVQAHLDPGLKAYIEYSNEVWNSLFGQAGYAKEQGKRLGLSDNDYQAQLFYYSLRSVQIFKIWTSILPKNRLVRVMGSQAVNPWVTQQVLTFQDAHLDTDALAVAPYFSMPESWETGKASQMTVDEVFKMIWRESLPSLFKMIREQAETVQQIEGGAGATSRAKSRDRISLVAYEGGQGLVGTGSEVDNPALNALFDNVNRSPRMKPLYLAYLKGWKDNGGKLFVHFTDCGAYSKWGRWGSLEYIGQEPVQAPKYSALQEFIRKNPAWWLGRQDSGMP